ncbi:MAG: hypothetical protein O9282_04375 [Flavobacterium sp.]|uniref:hypothetical protein n=1 Tax=Flavobacterium sp. TaxID=239 RepID=UPI0022CC924E|nr:hypothetical protein [Flavobacterium sp.]MCZ8330531.1 hypothetical protein [Flavobacterium sp.]
MNFNWKTFSKYLCAFGVIILSYIMVRRYNLLVQFDKSLEVLITINGIFSAILTTFLFARLNSIKEDKSKAKEFAIRFSRKITDLRRIFYELTTYYSVWINEEATKKLLDAGKYRTIDYYDYKMMSISDYIPANKDLINEFKEEKNYSDASSEMYLAMISLVENRSQYKDFDSVLYNDYESEDTMYNIEFIENILEVEQLSRLSYNLQRFDVFDFNRLSKDSRERIFMLTKRINSNYDLKNNFYKDVLIKMCEDFNSDIIPKTYNYLLDYEKETSSSDKIIIIMIKISLFFGVILPLVVLFLFQHIFLKILFSEFLMIINLWALVYFIINLGKFSKEQI